MALVDNDSTKGNGSTNALVLSELNGPFELKEVQLGELLPDEVIVKMIATGVCHTDVASATVCYHRAFPTRSVVGILQHHFGIS